MRSSASHAIASLAVHRCSAHPIMSLSRINHQAQIRLPSTPVRLYSASPAVIRRPTIQTQPAPVSRERATVTASSHVVRRRSFANKPPAMSSDDAYLSFLEKANRDPSAGASTQQQQHNPSSSSSFHTTKTIDTDQTVPQVLRDNVKDSYYESETDEPFEPVVLKWEGVRLPSSDEFKSLIFSSNTTAVDAVSVEILRPSSFDARNRYAGVLNAVRTAAGNDGQGQEGDEGVVVFCVRHGSTRVEYWILGLDGKQGRLVGVKARAVES